MQPEKAQQGNADSMMFSIFVGRSGMGALVMARNCSYLFTFTFTVADLSVLFAIAAMPNVDRSGLRGGEAWRHQDEDVNGRMR
jgi:hypothetical protein